MNVWASALIGAAVGSLLTLWWMQYLRGKKKR